MLFLSLVLTRWIHFASIALVFGGSLGALSLKLEAATRSKALQLVRVAIIFAAVSGVAWLAATIANAVGGPSSLLDIDLLRIFFVETPFGPPAIARLILFAALLTFAHVSPWPRGLIVATCAVSATLSLSQAWFGHAAEGGTSAYGALMIFSYAIHVLAASAWVGGLPILQLAISAARREGDGSRQRLHDLLTRYSAMAIVFVILIVASGIANTGFHVSAANAHLPSTSPYVQMLATKLGLVGIMLALAACNRIAILPHLLRADAGSNRLMATIAGEIVIAVLVFGAAAILGLIGPPV